MEFARERETMVVNQLERRGIRGPRVLHAMGSVPRERFVPVEYQKRAYADEPLPIGGGQTISQPYMVAAMTALLELKGVEKVLEIGTGCGYQAAVLSLLAKEIHSIELRSDLAASAAARLENLGYSNVCVHLGDGTMGLADHAPFDAILVAAAAPQIPEPLLDQLAEGGRALVPIGDERNQVLMLYRRENSKIALEAKEGCRFVPLLGRFGWR